MSDPVERTARTWTIYVCKCGDHFDATRFACMHCGPAREVTVVEVPVPDTDALRKHLDEWRNAPSGTVSADSPADRRPVSREVQEALEVGYALGREDAGGPAPDTDAVEAGAAGRVLDGLESYAESIEREHDRAMVEGFARRLRAALPGKENPDA